MNQQLIWRSITKWNYSNWRDPENLVTGLRFQTILTRVPRNSGDQKITSQHVTHIEKKINLKVSQLYESIWVLQLNPVSTSGHRWDVSKTQKIARITISKFRTSTVNISRVPVWTASKIELLVEYLRLFWYRICCTYL